MSSHERLLFEYTTDDFARWRSEFDGAIYATDADARLVWLELVRRSIEKEHTHNTVQFVYPRWEFTDNEDGSTTFRGFVAGN